VATYNLANYTSTDRRVEGIWWKDYPKPEVEKTALRAVIRSLAADVLVVQEIGGEAYLEELRHDLRREGLDYAYGEVLVGADTVRCVGVLSRRPFLGVTRHTDLTTRATGQREPVKRGALEVRVTFAGRPLTLWCLHLKSRLTDLTDDPQAARQRGEEAEAVRDRILQVYPDPAKAWFLTLGDFNDGRGSRTLKALQARGQTAIAAEVPAADTRGEVWTHYYARDEVYTRLDHVLASPGLAAAKGVTLAARIADGPDTAVASDHRPVVLTLRAQ
jgi:endonuclease/exonuclease/phosphatase family metal-dependent hydrolase